MRSILLSLTGLGLGLGLVAAVFIVDASPLKVDLPLLQNAHAGPPQPIVKHFDPREGFAPLVEALKPAVVSIDVTQRIELTQRMPEGMQPWFQHFFGEGYGDQAPYVEVPGQGSGFVISADGYILTNRHVVEDAEEVVVRFEDDRQYDARVVGSNAARDVALLKVETDDALPFVALGSSEALRVGDWVLAIGNPLGLTHTVTAGIVSAKGRFLNEGGRGFGRNYQAQDYVDFIQTDASINQGNSGGPLFNLKGEVVGINTAVSRAGQGIGFAVPIDLVQSILEDLKGGGKITRGWLGISLQSLDEHLARALEVKSDSGALIQQVGMGTPAEGAGLKPGDVITAIDGDTVADHEEVVRRIGLMRAGQAVKLTILRKGKRKIYEVTLGQRQTQLKLRENGDEGAQDPQTPETAGALPGLRLETRRGLGQVSAVVVTGVERTSSAFGRLRVGDEIVEINRARVQSSQEAERLLKRADGVALLLVNREGRRSFVAVPVR